MSFLAIPCNGIRRIINTEAIKYIREAGPCNCHIVLLDGEELYPDSPDDIFGELAALLEAKSLSKQQEQS